MNTRDEIVEDLALLFHGAPAPPPFDAALQKVLDAFACQTGTIHQLDPHTGMLQLVAQRGLPPALLPVVSTIPVGKGMAGQAAARREPVQLCNLQTDTSGVANPGARKTGMEGSIALPILVDGELRGTLGIAKASAYEYPAEEIALLMRVGALLAKHFAGA